MLNQCEVADRERHLTVHNPNNTCVHCCPKDFDPDDLPAFTEGLVFKCIRAEEKYDNGTQDAIEHPADDPEPTEKNILDTFLVEQRKLHERKRDHDIQQKRNMLQTSILKYAK